MATERRATAEREERKAVLVGAAGAEERSDDDDDWSRVVPRATAWRAIQVKMERTEWVEGDEARRECLSERMKEREGKGEECAKREICGLIFVFDRERERRRRENFSSFRRKTRVDALSLYSLTLLLFYLRFVVSPPFGVLPPPKHQNGSGRHCRRDQQGPRRHQDREDRQARREEGGE